MKARVSNLPVLVGVVEVLLGVLDLTHVHQHFSINFLTSLQNPQTFSGILKPTNESTNHRGTFHGENEKSKDMGSGGYAHTLGGCSFCGGGPARVAAGACWRRRHRTQSCTQQRGRGARRRTRRPAERARQRGGVAVVARLGGDRAAAPARRWRRRGGGRGNGESKRGMCTVQAEVGNTDASLRSAELNKEVGSETPATTRWTCSGLRTREMRRDAES